MARVNIYEEQFDTLLDHRGVDAIWEQAMVCNCVNRDTGQPNFVCPICGGSGYRYTQGKKIRVGVSAFISDNLLNSLLLREPGTAYCTPKADVIMGYKDRLYFPDFKCKFSEVIKWSTEDNGLGVSNKTYREIRGVLFLGDDTYEYEEGVDFEVTGDKFHLRWLDADVAKQKNDSNMSFLYYTAPSYLVDDLLHEVRATMSDRNTPSETFRELPKQYKIVREDFKYLVKSPEPLTIDDTGEGIQI